MLALGLAGTLGQEPHKVQDLVTRASSALLDWLSENWILAPGGKAALERARVEVFKDWYGPRWSVCFTMEDAPWFGDSVTLEMEELAPGDFRALLTEPQSFHRKNIECLHRGFKPQGHWSVNPAPSPRLQVVREADQGMPKARPRWKLGSRRWPPRGATPCFTQPPRDLGWADSRHWMEED